MADLTIDRRPDGSPPWSAQALLQDGLGAAIALAVLLAATGPLRTLDIAHTFVFWAGATAWGVLAFWLVRRVPTHRSRQFLATALLGITVVSVALAALFGLDPAAMPSLAPMTWLVLATVVAVAALATALARVGRIHAPGRSVLVMAVVALFVLFDLGVVKRGDLLRDLRLYLDAGERFAHGLQPYTLAPLPALLASQAAYPFLYPPVLLPIFGAMASVPVGVSAAAWTAIGLAGGVAGLRMLGLRGIWVVVLVLWPPFFEGLWAGNVAVPALVLLAAGFRVGRYLVLGPLLKVQTAVPSLWLLRQRLWRELAIGAGMAAGLCLVTLPLVGWQAWRDWLEGLRAFQASQQAYPVLYVFALPRHIPYGAFLAIGIVAIAWALSRGGPVGLARLGAATIVVSPSLYRHGLLAGLPAILALDSQLTWLTLGLPLTLWGVWISVAIAVVGTTVHLPGGPSPLDGHPAPDAPSRVPALTAATGRAVPSAG